MNLLVADQISDDQLVDKVHQEEKLVREIPEYSVHLDAIRGAAAALVYIVHLRLFFLQSISKHPLASSRTAMSSPAASAAVASGPGHTDYAHQAVMVFFVLSGFLVGGSVLRLIRTRQWSWRRYLVHRTVRLWMVLVPALVLGMVLDLAGSHHFAGQGTIYSAPAGQDLILSNFYGDRLTARTFVGNLFFLQTILVQPFGSNQPLWSLANEFWYYLAFPCLALALLTRKHIARKLWALALMAAILIFVGPKISLYFSIWLLGALAAALPRKIPLRWQRTFVAFALAAFLAGNLVVRYHEPNLFPVDLIIGVLFLLLLYGISHLQTPTRDSLYRRSARFMSKISYSLYLVHAPLLVLTSAILVGPWRLLPPSPHTAMVLAEVTLVVFLATCAIHYLFEARTDPVRDFLESRLAPRPRAKQRSEKSLQPTSV